MTTRRAISVLLFVGLGASLARSASADPRDLLREGMRLNGHGEYRQSLQVLEKAAQRSVDPQELGQIYLYLGFDRAILEDREGAERALRVALENDPDLEPDPRRFKPALLELFRGVRAQLGLLVVQTDRPGVTFALDGTSRGAMPARLRLPAGSYVLEVRRGSQARRLTVRLLAGQTAIRRVSFAEPAPKLASRPAVALPPAALPAPKPAPAEPPSFWHRRRVWTWVALGGAVATAGVAVGLEISTASDKNNWIAALNSYNKSHTPAAYTELENQKSSLESRWLAANVLYGVTGGLVLTSALLLFLEGRPHAERADAPSSPRVSLMPLVGGAGAMVTGHFQ